MQLSYFFQILSILLKKISTDILAEYIVRVSSKSFTEIKLFFIINWIFHSALLLLVVLVLLLVVLVLLLVLVLVLILVLLVLVLLLLVVVLLLLLFRKTMSNKCRGNKSFLFFKQAFGDHSRLHYQVTFTSIINCHNNFIKMILSTQSN